MHKMFGYAVMYSEGDYGVCKVVCWNSLTIQLDEEINEICYMGREIFTYQEWFLFALKNLGMLWIEMNSKWNRNHHNLSSDNMDQDRVFWSEMLIWETDERFTQNSCLLP